MNTKNNQRFHATETAMQAAMLELMKTLDFRKITVKKICEKAGVNRSTFYAHFTDVYDMLDKMEQTLHQELLDRYEKGQNELFSRESFLYFLQHIKEHKYFYKITLQTRKSFPLSQGYEYLQDIIVPLCHRAGITGEDKIMFYFIYFQAGFTMALKHWVDTDCQMSEEEIAQIIRNCIPGILVRR